MVEGSIYFDAFGRSDPVGDVPHYHPLHPDQGSPEEHLPLEDQVTWGQARTDADADAAASVDHNFYFLQGWGGHDSLLLCEKLSSGICEKLSYKLYIQAG